MAVNRASERYRGEGKTDAKDAAIIADQARIRRDLQVLRPGDELVAELKILTRHRRDLADDRTRVVNRPRGHLTGIFPDLERASDLTNTGPLILLTGYQTWPSGEPVSVVWKPGCATARSAAPPNWPRLPWRLLSTNRQACSARSRQPTGAHPGEGGDAPEWAGRRQRQADRGPVSRAPGLEGDHEHARHRAVAWRRIPRVHRRRHGGLRHPRPRGRLRRHGPSPTRLRSNQREPSPTEAIQRRTPTRLLHIGVDQHPLLRRVPPLLPSPTRRG